MPWNYDNFPSTFKYLSDETRRKAVDTANALLRQGMDEKQAIRIARSQAIEWARSRSGKYGQPQHVLPLNAGWGIQTDGVDHPNAVFSTKDEALHYAREIARSTQTDVIIHGMDGKIQERSSYA
jgi:uncharacterized protein YdaT